ncbi:hypothetical protein ACIBAI_22540 [Streptomyces sp. NPDC051041]|uniref:hypothetical protein n=1 Tax=Streptomyces sp. NPDC051041 TaxID=3365640 RepID=UPI003796A8F3
MPKKQSTAAKKARAAARQGVKYTAALRAAAAVPPGEGAARYGWDEIVVAALSDVVARDGVVPVRVIWSDETPPAHYNGERWGVAEPAADGYLIREVIYQQAAAAAVEKGTRIPVPYRTADGSVEVAALWPLVWHPKDDPRWRWAQNGWGVEAPGDILDGFDPTAPSPQLPYEVRVFNVPDGLVGETHQGATPSWQTWAWCADVDRAKELARALVAHRLAQPRDPRYGDAGFVRAQVWRHVTGNLAALPSKVCTVDADPDRPVVPRLPYGTCPPGRPESPDASRQGEPVWHRGQKHPPKYELKVWSETDGWISLAWIEGGRTPAGITADLLRVGAGGRWAFAETWGPRHPDAWTHDWTQEGRCVADRHPDTTFAEDSARIEAQRRAERGHLAAALAERSGGTLTVAQAAARLEQGGRAYRDFLSVGSAAIAQALHIARRAAAGDERLEIRRVLDALEHRHEVPDWAIGLADAHLARDTSDSPEMRAYRRRALQEYLSPGPDTDGIPGLSAG